MRVNRRCVSAPDRRYAWDQYPEHPPIDAPEIPLPATAEPSPSQAPKHPFPGMEEALSDQQVYRLYWVSSEQIVSCHVLVASVASMVVAVGSARERWGLLAKNRTFALRRLWVFVGACGGAGT